MTYDSTQDTREHIETVRNRLQECISNLTVRAYKHDASKLQEPEKSAYDRIGPPGHVAYSRDGQMTPEYQAFLDTLGSTLDHHYAHNSHHPQHYQNGMDGFSLLDLVEWLCDIKAAGERYKDGNLAESLKTNRTRFAISDQLYAILENTVKELGW
jgi:hypothetical protein